ncbi:MAG TPA: prolyl oligopeptidase family serine peptidase [Thermoanaerobaculia bacterium]|nr:prolyl oligopeptidase family serine peptidase [Thermoanaerobaculia bacterium]
MLRRALILLAFAVAPALHAQLTIDTIMRGQGLTGWSPRDVRWAADGQHVYFRWKQYTDPVEKDYDTYVVGRDGKGLRKLTEDEAKDAPPSSGDFTRDRKRTVFIDQGDVYLYDSAAGKRRALTSTNETESHPRFTRDEQHVAFVRGNNLYVLSLIDASLVQRTNILGPNDKSPLWDEKEKSDSQSWIEGEEKKLIDVVARRSAKKEKDEKERKEEKPVKPLKLKAKQTVVDLQLTADEQYVIVFIGNEEEKERKANVPNYVTESAYTEEIPSRTKVGDASAATRVGSISMKDGEVKWLTHEIKSPPPQQKETTSRTEKVENTKTTGATKETKATKAEERDIRADELTWSEDGSKAVLALRSEDNKDWWIVAFDPVTAKTRVLATEHDPAWVRWPFRASFGFLPDDSTVWYLSEASGWMHLYTVPFAGGTPKQITSGKWEVDAVDVANDRSAIYLTTSEQSLYERHVYRMRWSGGLQREERLTSATGDHDAVASPDETMLADVHSYTNKPPELYLQPIGGEPLQITTSPAPEFAQYAWKDVPIVTFKARDGAEVPARLYEPANWNGGPAVIFVHGAGYLQNVHRWWSNYFREYMFHHFLNEHGYLVLDVDYRASAGHGRDWRTAIYRHMGGVDLDDHVDAAKWLVATHKVDAKRIGIYGGSYGGFITLMAMFTTPDVFAAGAALRPVTDWAHYNNGYTSAILNTPQKDPEAYRQSSPIYFADGLKGALLICHGVVDTNVHFQDTVRLTQRLIELRKENWDVAMYPVEDHSFVEPTSWADEYKRIYRLFERTLK